MSGDEKAAEGNASLSAEQNTEIDDKSILGL